MRRFQRNAIKSARELGNPERGYELMFEDVPPPVVEDMRAKILETIAQEQQQRRRRLRRPTAG